MPWQNGTVKIKRSQAWNGEKLRLQNLPVGGNDKNVTIQIPELVQFIRCVNSLWLKYGNSHFEGQVLDLVDMTVVPAARAIWLRINARHLMFRCAHQGFKHWQCKLTGSEQNDSHDERWSCWF